MYDIKIVNGTIIDGTRLWKSVRYVCKGWHQISCLEITIWIIFTWLTICFIKYKKLNIC